MSYMQKIILACLFLAGLQCSFMDNSMANHMADSQIEPAWKSDPLHATWFGNIHKIRFQHDGVMADWVIVKAGKHFALRVEEISVKYLDRHHHPRKVKFYPYQYLHDGERVRFEFKKTRQVIGVNVKVTGESGSRSKDRFRIILSKNIEPPPRGFAQTGSFYGKCIGGSKCPGYRRNHITRFSIDLEDVMNIRKIEFFSHDRIGRNHNGKINVYVDDSRVAKNIDIKKRGSVNIIELKKVKGRHIIFEAAANDEVMIQQISVDYNPYSDRWNRRNGKHRDRKDRQRHRRH